MAGVLRAVHRTALSSTARRGERSRRRPPALAAAARGGGEMMGVAPPPPSLAPPDDTFTPVHAALGGLVLAAAVVTKMRNTGEVLGVSGNMRGALLGGPRRRGKVAFVLGLALAGVVAKAAVPVLVPAPPELSTLRVVGAGLAVGLGTTVGNGCTSGHGLCGLGRLSFRSLVATCAFMATGMATALLSGSAAAMGVTSVSLAPAAVPSPVYAVAGFLLLVATAVQMALIRAKGKVESTLLADLSDAVTGVVFGAGLVLAGMVDPRKVATFLSPLTPAFDPSLAFVMGGALLVIWPVYAMMLGEGEGDAGGAKGQKPAFTTKFASPRGFKSGSNAVVDAPLVGGAALFGCGWGLAGVCPGPAMVQFAANPCLATLAFVAAFVVGQMLAPTAARLAPASPA